MKGRLFVCCIVKEEKKILLMVEKIIVCASCAFKRIVVETRSDLNVERRDDEIYPVVYVGMGVPTCSVNDAL